jgi:predicted transposase YdaD
MIASLDAAGKQDLLPLGYAFAALVFKKEDQREWLRKRFEMLHDMLEESWAYQEMVQKGLQQGLEQGLQEGELRALRQAIVDVVQERFPEIMASVKKRVQTIEDPSLLRLVIVKMSTLPTAKEAQQYVRSIGKDRKDSYKSR